MRNRVIVICKTMWRNLRYLFSKFETLLAWLAIFIWLSDVAWRFTELDGFTNMLYRLVIWNWLDWKPIAEGGWYKSTFSGFYWFGIGMLLLVAALLIRKIFKKREDEPIERIERALKDIKEILGDNEKSIDSPSGGNGGSTKKMGG